jgi:ectoine hydroxylase-related dioxygenase (phytanoyl-CoA dioxygenase family)
VRAYPAELLTEYPSMIIPVETGDLCVFNGNLVHAVLRGNTTWPKKRLLITFFMAFNHDHELIWWT